MLGPPRKYLILSPPFKDFALKNKRLVCAYCGSEKEKLKCKNCGASKNEKLFLS